ncbi:putative segment polarity protein dishevelled homolog DVL1P1 [Corythoichthys intestinalis]|uniref:putative segment polarity protein dishevelled homolog DVL1P1 n=1 Tax=Corythoichthys intestinalis TaxID=161448 RepID=UPI0025A683BB|nr:putative segment polarity protein dishevelled homolog DVL1P1 [Corythoichthys intestinalis]
MSVNAAVQTDPCLCCLPPRHCPPRIKAHRVRKPSGIAPAAFTVRKPSGIAPAAFTVRKPSGIAPAAFTPTRIMDGVGFSETRRGEGLVLDGATSTSTSAAAVSGGGDSSSTSSESSRRTPRSVFALPQGEPVRPIDPASWVWHTAAVTGMLLPPYGEDERLSADGDMARVAAAMLKADSGVARRPRTWLKVVLPDAFTGSEAVGWLRRNVSGAGGRAEARRYAARLLENGFIRHAVDTRARKGFSQKRYYVAGGSAPAGDERDPGWTTGLRTPARP